MNSYISSVAVVITEGEFYQGVTLSSRKQVGTHLLRGLVLVFLPDVYLHRVTKLGRQLLTVLHCEGEHIGRQRRGAAPGQLYLEPDGTEHRPGRSGAVWKVVGGDAVSSNRP
jgi:hypothetical protein